ncbi:MAG: ferrous iron transport protein B [Myxococcales bacterium]|nr:ferrous iron transport protein B [Myxococcales bacterium]
MDPASCEGCDQHRATRLQKLGISIENADAIIALAGNPNTGKSTVFNSLTGLRQHTGNWPGKTVARAEGGLEYENRRYKLVDLPGTYSLLSTSYDEEIARDFILFGRPDATLVVVDATRLESSLNLVLQILEITDRVIVCLNLMDEARRKGLRIDDRSLSRDLGVPVIPMSARYGEGMAQLLEMLHAVTTGSFHPKPHRLKSEPPTLRAAVSQLAEKIHTIYPQLPNARWVAMRLLDSDQRLIEAVHRGELGTLHEFDAQEDVAQVAPNEERSAIQQEPDDVGKEILSLTESLRFSLTQDFHGQLMEALFTDAAQIADRAVSREGEAERFDWDRAMDRIVTSRRWGIPLMLLMFAGVFWLTISGANVPSAMLSDLLVGKGQPWLRGVFTSLGSPTWFTGFCVDGMYLSTAWVISVMLPPMAIFFPMFTLLEDLGYLPRVAFNLDRVFQRSGTHGKQALSMMMGFGCNAAGVIATRVIDSPRDRLIAILTNNFSLCNGRWPTQILMATIFLGVLAPTYLSSTVATLAVVAIALFGIAMMFFTSWLLSRTMLRGEPASFTLELPPYRPPRILQTLYTSLIDRTLFVLWRAVVFALPAGAVIWLISNIQIANKSVASYMINFSQPFGLLIGLNGVILVAYIVAIPANEIVIPTVLMLTLLTTKAVGGAGAGVLYEPGSASVTLQILKAGGWTTLTAINLMLFSLLHNPCSTTIYTIYKETGSAKWAFVATVLPLVMGVLVTFVVAQSWGWIARLFV